MSTSRDTEEMLKKTLVTAQKASEEAIASAKAKAEQLISEAEQRVNRANEEARARMSSLEDELRRKTLDADREHAVKKRELDASIDRLRAFETELKQRLKVIPRTADEVARRALRRPPEDFPTGGSSERVGASRHPITPPGRPQAAPAVSHRDSAKGRPPDNPPLDPRATPSRRVTLDPAGETDAGRRLQPRPGPRVEACEDCSGATSPKAGT